MELNTITYETKELVGILTINREKQFNSLNAETIGEITGLLKTIRIEHKIRALIITGAGKKAFIAGADIAEIQRLGLKDGPDFIRAGNDMNRLIENLGIPTIAAINGLAFGGGCEVALACPLRVAAANAKFALPESGLGVIPGFGGTQRLPRIIGPNWAMWYLLTGEIFGAEKALELGMVHKVVAEDDLLSESLRIAKTIATKAPLAVSATLEAMKYGTGIDLETGIAFESSLVCKLLGSKDKAEGITAFLEKRIPAFKGE